MADVDYRPYVGDVGTVIEVDMGEDLSSFTTLTFKVLKKYDNTTTTWTAQQKAGGGNENIMQYTIVADDFNVPGKYVCQPYGVTPGWSGHGDSFEFTVFELYS
jgi:hypothetical protein